MASTALTIRTKKRNIVGDFARYFGNESQLVNWQRLCRDIGLRDDLPSIKKCRAVSGLFMQLCSHHVSPGKASALILYLIGTEEGICQHL
jgi:hypothetical protein